MTVKELRDKLNILIEQGNENSWVCNGEDKELKYLVFDVESLLVFIF